MTKQELLKLLVEVAPTVEWSDLAVEDSMEEAGLDSLDKTSLVLEIENSTGIKVEDSVYDQLDTIESFMKLGN